MDWRHRRRHRHRHRHLALSTIIVVALLLQQQISIITPTESLIILNASMTWQETWKNILVEGGPKRWKVDDRTIKQQALQTIVSKYTSAATAAAAAAAGNPPQAQPTLDILCPLAGDDPFVHEAWLQGHTVTSIDLVPQAVDAMRQQFGNDNSQSDEDWQKEEVNSTIIWHHKPTGRATLYVGDVLQERPELVQKFDVIYDKDSFGALDPTMRPMYCRRLAEYLKDDGIVYTEVKFKTDPAGRSNGPPFHVDRDDLMETSSFGNGYFQYVEGLGEVYSQGMPGMLQTAHILQRLPRSSSPT